MQILVDADACPVISIVERTAREKGIPVVLLCDTNHVLHSDYSEIRICLLYTSGMKNIAILS